MLPVDELTQYTSEKVLDFTKSIELINELKQEGKSVGLCHGGFDLTHPGHIKHFESAKKLCDILFVSVTSNQFVTSRKGSGRPIYTDKLRAYIIAGVQFVDYVVISDFAKGVEIIKLLKPSYYIKGPDFIHKTTPGITSEREAIKGVGGEIKYTTEAPMSTTRIINYIKHEVDNNEVLVILDRDGTIIKNDNFFGKNDNWKDEIEYMDDVIAFISFLQTKFKTTKVIITNQTGVARRFFTTKRVQEINQAVIDELNKRGIKIDGVQYCPDADASYVDIQEEKGVEFDNNYVKKITKRKPSIVMVDDALKKLNKSLNDFNKVIVIGNNPGDDGGLADNLQAQYIDVNNKSYEDLVRELKD